MIMQIIQLSEEKIQLLESYSVIKRKKLSR